MNIMHIVLDNETNRQKVRKVYAYIDEYGRNALTVQEYISYKLNK